MHCPSLRGVRVVVALSFCAALFCFVASLPSIAIRGPLAYRKALVADSTEAQETAPATTPPGPTTKQESGPYSSTFEQICTAGSANHALFQEYADFHRTCRQNASCLSSALVWQCDEKDLCGGLGDEIRGLVFTMLTAMALKRPFFVRWRKMGQNLLDLFTTNAIDVRPPADLPRGCDKFSIIDQTDPRVWFSKAKDHAGCASWVTNMDLFWESGSLAAEVLPAMKDIKLEAVIGCGVNYMFKPSGLTAAEGMNFPPLPEVFTAIHLRCDDKAMERKPVALNGTDEEVESSLVQTSLQCARKLQSKTVVFVSCSESAKQTAVRLSGSMGLTVLTSRAQARHIDHDHNLLSAPAFRAALWSDFLVLQQASTLIRSGSRVSGFSGVAASMGFMPVDKMWRVSGDPPVCAPDESFHAGA